MKKRRFHVFALAGKGLAIRCRHRYRCGGFRGFRITHIPAVEPKRGESYGARLSLLPNSVAPKRLLWATLPETIAACSMAYGMKRSDRV
jgi:hypothetical protein